MCNKGVMFTNALLVEVFLFLTFGCTDSHVELAPLSDSDPDGSCAKLIVHPRGLPGRLSLEVDRTVLLLMSKTAACLATSHVVFIVRVQQATGVFFFA